MLRGMPMRFAGLPIFALIGVLAFFGSFVGSFVGAIAQAEPVDQGLLLSSSKGRAVRMTLPPESATPTGYSPRVLTWEKVRAEFNLLVPGPYEGPGLCAERAYVWSDQMARHSAIESMKVFLFFSDKFRKTFGHLRNRHQLFRTRNDFGWWYHAAPLVYVGDQKEEIVLDPQFFKSPVSLREWTEYFVSVDPGLRASAGLWTDAAESRLTFDQAHCERLTDLNRFDLKTTGEWCALRIVPMYYLGPFDLYCLDGLSNKDCRQDPVLRAFDSEQLKTAEENYYSASP